MKRHLLGSLFIVLLIAPLLAVSQQPRVVRVGVAAEESLSSVVPPNSTIDARAQRDLLVSYLNQRKPGQKSQVRVEAIALTTLDPQGIVSEARENGCDYVVELYLSTFNPFPVNAPEGRWNYSATGQPEAPPGGISYFLRDVRDSSQSTSNGFSGAWRRQAAMSVMSSVYEAIVKAATP